MVFSCLAQMSANNQFQLANELFNIGYSDKAAVEYLRFTYYFAEDQRGALAKYRAGLCFDESERPFQARKIYNKIISGGRTDSLSNGARYRLSLSYFKSGDTPSSLFYIEKYILDCDIKCQLSLVYLEGWNYFWERKYSEALRVFGRIETGELDSSSFFMQGLSQQGLALPRRSPYLVAGMSAILPGSGRAYLGRWGDALINLVVIGGSFAGSYLMWDDDRSFSIGLLISGAIFYGGNIYGSWVGAKYFNEQKHRDLYNYAKKYVPRRPEELYRY